MPPPFFAGPGPFAAIAEESPRRQQQEARVWPCSCGRHDASDKVFSKENATKKFTWRPLLRRPLRRPLSWRPPFLRRFLLRLRFLLRFRLFLRLRLKLRPHASDGSSLLELRPRRRTPFFEGQKKVATKRLPQASPATPIPRKQAREGSAFQRRAF